MFDFTLKTYQNLLQRLSSLPCRPFAVFVQDSSPAGIVLRHDVDRLPRNSLVFARLQYELSVRGSYYFRLVPEGFDAGIIEEIAGLGHEVGYHYEDVSLTAREMRKDDLRLKINEVRFQKEKSRPIDILLEQAIGSFEKNLARLRQVAEVRTICMHGSPLSKWDSRLLWEK